MGKRVYVVFFFVILLVVCSRGGRADGSCGSGYVWTECGRCVQADLQCTDTSVCTGLALQVPDSECVDCECTLPDGCVPEHGRCPDEPGLSCCPGLRCGTPPSGFDECLGDGGDGEGGYSTRDCGCISEETIEGDKKDIATKDCDPSSTDCSDEDGGCRWFEHAIWTTWDLTDFNNITSLKMHFSGYGPLFVWYIVVKDTEGNKIYQMDLSEVAAGYTCKIISFLNGSDYDTVRVCDWPAGWGNCIGTGPVGEGKDLILDLFPANETNPISVGKIQMLAHDSARLRYATPVATACAAQAHCGLGECPSEKVVDCLEGTCIDKCADYEWPTTSCSEDHSKCQGNSQDGQGLCEETHDGKWQADAGCCGGDGEDSLGCGDIRGKFFCTGTEWLNVEDYTGCTQSCDDELYFSTGEYWLGCEREMHGYAVLEGTENDHSYICHDAENGFEIYECRGMDMQPVCSGGTPPAKVLGPGESIDFGAGEEGEQEEKEGQEEQQDTDELCSEGRAVVQVTDIPIMDDGNKDKYNKGVFFCIHDNEGYNAIMILHRYNRDSWPDGQWWPSWRFEAGATGCSKEWHIFQSQPLDGSEATFEIEWGGRHVTVTNKDTGDTQYLDLDTDLAVSSFGPVEECPGWGWSSPASAELVEWECYENGSAGSCGGGDTDASYSGVTYCRSDGGWGDDLDTPEDQSSDETKIAKQSTCEAAGEAFTGTYCCSEVDDDIKYDTPSETKFWQNFESIKTYLPANFPQDYDLQSNETYFDTDGICWFGTPYDGSEEGDFVSAYTASDCKEQDEDCGFTLECCQDLYCFDSKCQDISAIEDLEDTYKIKYDVQHLSDMHLSETIIQKEYDGQAYLLGCDIYKNFGDFTNQVTGEIDANKPFQSSIIFAFLQNYPDPGDTSTYLAARESGMVMNMPYCSLSDEEGYEQGYYCSYLEYWKEVPEEWGAYFTEPDEDKRELLKPKLSWVAWPQQYFNSANQSMADCCLGTSCWDGEKCVEDMARKPSEQGINPDFRCIAGLWVSQGLKYNWDMTKSGYCKNDTWCLVDGAGDPDYNTSHEYYNNTDPLQRPTCIQPGDYIEDHYCEDGRWTTRTKKLAEELYSAVGKEDQMTIFCDRFDEADIIKIVNNIEYDLDEEGTMPLDIFTGTCVEGVTEVPCINNLCVITAGETVAFATTFSGNQSDEEQSILRLARKNKDYCDNAMGKEYFERCGTKEPYTYYNDKLGGVVISNSKLTFSSGSGLGRIYEWFKDFLERFFGSNPEYPEGPDGELDFTFVANTSSYSEIYLHKVDDRKIAAIREEVYQATGSLFYLAISYDSFDSSICAAINNETDYTCFVKGKKQYVIYSLAGEEDELVSKWNTLTSSMRINPAERKQGWERE